ncbi:MAG: cell wall associated biofilm protein, partial [Frankiales bacterium]|nr:cell wall associated biofilm protein [Frankiales bacterium]
MATTFTFTGAVQTFTVPAGTTLLQVECWAAQGNEGGLGGYARGTIPVTPGEQLQVRVGGQPSGNAGGFNGGGSADTNPSGHGGGGGTDVRRAAGALTDRLIVAGGGGGGVTLGAAARGG